MNICYITSLIYMERNAGVLATKFTKNNLFSILRILREVTPKVKNNAQLRPAF